MQAETCGHLADNSTEINDLPFDCPVSQVMCDGCWDAHWPNCEVCRELMREDL